VAVPLSTMLGVLDSSMGTVVLAIVDLQFY